MSNIPFSALPVDTVVTDPDNTFVICVNDLGDIRRLSVTDLNTFNSGGPSGTPSPNWAIGSLIAFVNSTQYNNGSIVFDIANNDGGGVELATGLPSDGVVSGEIPAQTTVYIKTEALLPDGFLDIKPVSTPGIYGEVVDIYSTMTVWTDTFVATIEANSPDRIEEAYTLPQGTSRVYLTTTDTTFTNIGSEILGVCYDFTLGRISIRNLTSQTILVDVKVNIWRANRII